MLSSTIIDIMEWMINTQLGRRNLPPQQRVAVVQKFKKKIQEQAKETQGTRTDLTSSPNGEKVKSTHTDKELAKMAGVGVGTIARYNRVMNSDDEDLKRKVRTGEIKIGTAYREVKKLSFAIFHKRANEFYCVKVFVLAKEYSVEVYYLEGR